MLLHNGAEPNLRDSDDLTPLHLAVVKGQLEGVNAIAKLNKVLGDHEKFEINATSGPES